MKELTVIRVERIGAVTYRLQFCTEEGDENLRPQEVIELDFKTLPPQEEFERKFAYNLKTLFPGIFHEQAFAGAIHCLMSNIAPDDCGCAEIPGICKRAYNQLHG